jgi:MFS family permease
MSFLRNRHAPVKPVPAARPAFVLAIASAACALIVLDTNVVAVSLPSIARSFHASFADVEWVVSAYMVAFASCLLSAGALADRVGRKRMLLVGLAVFSLASLGCGLAASALLTAALAVIANTFHDGPARVRAWAVWGTCIRRSGPGWRRVSARPRALPRSSPRWACSARCWRRIRARRSSRPYR